ncbi:MAG: hypothetical protein IPK26_08855 [Planctomycetes bacterium]|nr:hypothetical protein [Planctomycetota bacterium]
MTAHLPPEVLIAFQDGTLDESTEREAAAHLHRCTECAQQLAELRSVDEFVAPAAAARTEAGAAMTEAAMFDVAQRVLTQPRTSSEGARAGPGRPGWLAPLLLAALGLLAATLYATMIADAPAAAVGIRVHRYTADQAMRGAAHRFHVELDVPAPRWLAVFARTADGRIEQLFPSVNPALASLDTPMPLRAGTQRVPAEAMLDWEFDGDRPPQMLWVVPMPDAPDNDGRRWLRDLLTNGADPTIASALQQRFRDARAVPFPRL